MPVISDSQLLYLHTDESQFFNFNQGRTLIKILGGGGGEAVNVYKHICDYFSATIFLLFCFN